MAAGHSWTWHFHFMVVTSWVGLSTWWLSYLGLSYHPLLLFCVNAANPFSIADRFKRSHSVWTSSFAIFINLHFHDLHSWTLCRQSHSISKNHYTHFVSLMWDTSRPSSDESLLVYIRTLSKKATEKHPFSTLRLAYINGKFLASDNKLTSLAFDRKNLYGVRHQNIHSHYATCTAVPWGSLSLSVIYLTSVNYLHHWLVIRWCLPMFGFKSHICMVRLVLERTIEWDRRPWI